MSANFDVFTFGETMLRLSPAGMERLEGSTRLEMSPGGTESNVAVALARLGKRVAWFSRLPDTPMGRSVTGVIRQHGVDTSSVKLVDNERMGLYFVEQGVAPRAVRVWYDRANSAASKISAEDIPLEVLQASRWLHLTGITPALSLTCAEAVQYALEQAKFAGIPVSFDVNYRALLWDTKKAAASLEPVCRAATVVFVAKRDAQQLFGVEGDVDTCVKQLHERWQNTVIMSDGEHGAVAVSTQGFVRVPGKTVQIIDRVGAGDAFAAGVICRLLEAATLDDALRFGVALASLALTIPGDIALVTRDEVEALLTDSGGGIRR